MTSVSGLAFKTLPAGKLTPPQCTPYKAPEKYRVRCIATEDRVQNGVAKGKVQKESTPKQEKVERELPPKQEKSQLKQDKTQLQKKTNSKNLERKSKPRGLQAGWLIDGIKERLLGGVKEQFLDSFVEIMYREIDVPNPILEGNFAPIRGLYDCEEVEVIEGEIPKDFPVGTYVRNGPNPFYFPKAISSPFGITEHDWTEGDGMLHGVSIDEERQAVYTNKYVRTVGLEKEIESGKRMYLPLGDCDPEGMVANASYNLMRFGSNKVPANTSVVSHHEKVFALHEGGLPYRVSVPDLETLDVEDFEGTWDKPVTAHPKVCPDTGEMIIYGTQLEKPYVTLGVVSAKGRLLHQVELDLERATLMHDFAITTNYNVIMDLPLTLNKARLARGENLATFESGSYARIGLMPRFGSAESLRWFEIDPCYAWHTVNAFEDGDEVVVHALRQRRAILRPWSNFFAFSQGVTPTPYDPLEDSDEGSLASYFYEWRLNLKTGEVREKPLANLLTVGDYPRINERSTGKKYKYAYTAAMNVEVSSKSGVPKFGGVYKHHVPESKDSRAPMGVEYHPFGKNRFGGEPVFVPRIAAKSEDDGYVVTYVHDENINKSEMYIIDAQAFESKPVARLRLPQRVPYGFHGAFIRAN